MLSELASSKSLQGLTLFTKSLAAFTFLLIHPACQMPSKAAHQWKKAKYLPLRLVSTPGCTDRYAANVERTKLLLSDLSKNAYDSQIKTYPD